MTRFRAADVAKLFEHFGARPTQAHSCYPWSPVFPAERDGVAVVLKRAAPRTADAVAEWCRHLASSGISVVTPVELGAANPVVIDGEGWVLYPWIDGRRYDASLSDLAEAGDLLGRVHGMKSTGLKPFSWPEYEPGEPARDLPELREKFTEHASDQTERVMDRLGPLGRSFERVTLPAIRDAGLPVVDATMDYKANNLVFSDTGPVLIDPDNGECLPRILDLALAALMFHTELEEAPGRPFTALEWAVFRDAYLGHVELTEAEAALWPTAIDYMLWENGTWAMADSTEWHVSRQRSFLVSLAQVQPESYPL